MFHHVFKPMVAPANTSAGLVTRPAAKATAQVVQNSPETVPNAFWGSEPLTDSSMNRAVNKDSMITSKGKDNEKHPVYIYI